MNTIPARAALLAFSLAFGSGAMAQSLSKAEYTSARGDIAAQYKSDRAACAPMAPRAKEACRTEAKAKRKAARADLAARYTPAPAPAPSQAAAPASKKAAAGAYIDDSVITAKVKAAVFEDASLKSTEINVETNKGVVQLSGFVRSRADINKAVAVARRIKGVTSVKNDMVVKGQQ